MAPAAGDTTNRSPFFHLGHWAEEANEAGCWKPLSTCPRGKLNSVERDANSRERERERERATNWRTYGQWMAMAALRILMMWLNFASDVFFSRWHGRSWRSFLPQPTRAYWLMVDWTGMGKRPRLWLGGGKKAKKKERRKVDDENEISARGGMKKKFRVSRQNFNCFLFLLVMKLGRG